MQWNPSLSGGEQEGTPWESLRFLLALWLCLSAVNAAWRAASRGSVGSVVSGTNTIMYSYGALCVSATTNVKREESQETSSRSSNTKRIGSELCFRMENKHVAVYVSIWKDRQRPKTREFADTAKDRWEVTVSCGSISTITLWYGIGLDSQ